LTFVPENDFIAVHAYLYWINRIFPVNRFCIIPCFTILYLSNFFSNTAISASVNRAMTRMIDINILFKRGKEISFVNPFFKAWLLPRGR